MSQRDGFREKDDKFPVKSERNIIQRKQDDPKTCSQCIVVVAPYPSSLGGVYQPGRTETETHLSRLPLCVY